MPKTLQKIAITNQLDWLKHDSFTSGQDHWLPNGFDAHLKLLLPVGIDHSIPLEEYFPKRSTIAEMNARAAFWRKYDIGCSSATDDKLTPIRYRELAKIWNVPYDKDFTSKKIVKAAANGHPTFEKALSWMSNSFNLSPKCLAHQRPPIFLALLKTAITTR